MFEMFENLFGSKKRDQVVVQAMPEPTQTVVSGMKLSDFDMVRILGSGSFGRVKFAKSKVDGQYYAVKCMKKHDIIKMKQGMFFEIS
jgi:serine/threonine protein kinase